MSPRPKTAPDAVILEAAARLLSRLGPARMRLEDVAREVGLAPATLLLRFKSKRNLLLAVAEHGITGMADYFRERRQRSRSALHAVTDVCDSLRELAEAPQQLANLLAFIQLSLEDPEFRAASERHDAALAHEMRRLLDEARGRGELIEVSTKALSRAVIAMMRGSLLTWSAIGQDTRPDAWVKADLDTLIAPYRRAEAGGDLSAPARARRAPADSGTDAPSRKASRVGRRPRPPRP
ncbi:MAG TPA: helix-turn-helix domain-containing protein [Vicinamibacterales bacterium]|nr:helix-turn-helix domain-containing protein [Vicinamibacterales bacterium]